MQAGVALPRTELIDNGTGLGLLIGDLTGVGFGPVIDVYDVSDTSVTTDLQTRFLPYLEAIEQHELLELLDHPNPAQSGTEFRRYLTSYHQLAGNAYIAGLGAKLETGNPKPSEEPATWLVSATAYSKARRKMKSNRPR